MYNPINGMSHINKLRGKKSQMTIVIGTEEAFYEIKHPFLIETLSKLSIQETFLNTISIIYDKSMASIR